jgi:hypothetical protein
MSLLTRKALKRAEPLNLALLDAATEVPGQCLGTVVSMHRTRSEALINQMDYEEEQSRSPRRELLYLEQKVLPGTLVLPDDLQPQSRQEANR